MIDVTNSADVANDRGASGEFDQLVEVSEVGQPPAVVRGGTVEDVRSDDVMSSLFELIGNVGPNEPSGACDNHFRHGADEELAYDKTNGQRT